MSNMSSVYKDRSTKKVLLGCSEGYLASKKDLLAAIVSLKSGQFDDAETSVTMTLDRHMSCLKRIEKHKEVQISSKLAYEMKIYEDLCQIADRIIERLQIFTDLLVTNDVKLCSGVTKVNGIRVRST